MSLPIVEIDLGLNQTAGMVAALLPFLEQIGADASRPFTFGVDDVSGVGYLFAWPDPAAAETPVGQAIRDGKKVFAKEGEFLLLGDKDIPFAVARYEPLPAGCHRLARWRCNKATGVWSEVKPGQEEPSANE